MARWHAWKQFCKKGKEMHDPGHRLHIDYNRRKINKDEKGPCNKAFGLAFTHTLFKKKKRKKKKAYSFPKRHQVNLTNPKNGATMA